MKEVKEKYLKEIYLNVLKAIITTLFFFILNLAYENISSEHLSLGIEILTMVFLFIAIYIFEKAYKKDDGNLAIQGIEILILATYTLTSRHITNKFNFEFKAYSAIASYIFAIYFVLKGIIVYTKGRREEAEELSDIREIVKKEEPLKKEATKKSKNNKKEDEEKEIQVEIKEDDKKSEETKKTADKKKNSSKKTTTKNSATKKTTSTKKSSTTKKTTKKAEEKPKTKTTKSKKQEDEKIESKEQENEKPKRKRTKKEVKEND